LAAGNLLEIGGAINSNYTLGQVLAGRRRVVG
jgi:hypothetical protein